MKKNVKVLSFHNHFYHFLWLKIQCTQLLWRLLSISSFSCTVYWFSFLGQDDQPAGYYYNGNYYYYEDYVRELSPAVMTEIEGLEDHLYSPNYPSEQNPDGVYPNNANLVWYRYGNETTMIQVGKSH